MGTTLHLNRSRTLWARIAEMFAFFSRIVIHLPHLTLADDDPSALRYSADKYNGEID